MRSRALLLRRSTVLHGVNAMNTNTEKTKPQTPALLPIPEAAKQLSVSKATLYRRINSGEIRSVKLGALRRVPLSEITRLAESAT
jgi:excisionase family DNA binding protein